eukprot:m.134766 g.134766  ORF g.134766 m.134766 type:complete len:82 (-) comp13965_c0_seq2:260-505(-)
MDRPQEPMCPLISYFAFVLILLQTKISEMQKELGIISKGVKLMQKELAWHQKNPVRISLCTTKHINISAQQYSNFDSTVTA